VLALISHEDDDICEGDEGIIGFVEFVIASMNSPKLLYNSKVTFDNIPALVQLLIVLPRLLAITFRRYHRYHYTLFRLRSAGITLIRSVHNQMFAQPNLLRYFYYQLFYFNIFCY